MLLILSQLQVLFKFVLQVTMEKTLVSLVEHQSTDVSVLANLTKTIIV